MHHCICIIDNGQGDTQHLFFVIYCCVKNPWIKWLENKFLYYIIVFWRKQKFTIQFNRGKTKICKYGCCVHHWQWSRWHATFIFCNILLHEKTVDKITRKYILILHYSIFKENKNLQYNFIEAKQNLVNMGVAHIIDGCCVHHWLCQRDVPHHFFCKKAAFLAENHEQWENRYLELKII